MTAIARIALQRPDTFVVMQESSRIVAPFDDTVTLKPVALARELGRTVEIRAGLAGTDRVIENPPDGIPDGTRVVPVADTPRAP